jgi:CRP-like cAMP-binding protein
VAWDDPKLIESLRAVPLFTNLDDLALAQIAAVATPVRVQTGHVLMHAGQEGSGVFIIQEGVVGVEIGGRVIECVPGEMIGELSLLVDGLVHTGRVRALGAVECLAISRDDFGHLLETEPRIAVNMLKVLATRLANTDRLLAES